MRDSSEASLPGHPCQGKLQSFRAFQGWAGAPRPGINHPLIQETRTEHFLRSRCNGEPWYDIHTPGPKPWGSRYCCPKRVLESTGFSWTSRAQCSGVQRHLRFPHLYPRPAVPQNPMDVSVRKCPKDSAGALNIRAFCSTVRGMAFLPRRSRPPGIGTRAGQRFLA